MRTLCLWALCLLFATNTSYGQTVNLEGYVFEQGNRGYLNLAKVSVLDRTSKALISQTASNMEGVFNVALPVGKEYLVRVEKDLFVVNEKMVSTVGKTEGEKTFVKFQMERKPGYVFDVTIAEKAGKDMPSDAVQGARIDVFNNTKDKELMVLENHPNPTFKTHFEEGNHYTVLIRKKGFFNKRLEAFVNVKGCILCFEGVGNVRPSDVLTEGHSMGTLLANVELQPIEVGKGIKVENIYYDTDRYRIRKDAAAELDKLIGVLNDNPALIVELGSHTDARGKDNYNLSLSDKRAKAAVDYILTKSNVARHRINAKGYGETQLVNSCKNGVECKDEQHQENRRTELKIVGFLSNDPYQNKSLAEIIEEEKFEKLLSEVGNGEQYKVPEDGSLPADLEAQLQKEKEKEMKAKMDTIVPDKPATKPATIAVLENETAPKPSTPKKEVINTPKPNHTPSVPESKPVPSEPIVATTPARPGASKPYKPQTEQAPSPADFATTSEGFDESITASVGESTDSRIISEIPVSNTRTRPRIQKLPVNYSGYRIEFFNAPFELLSSHEIFSKHGEITVEQKKDGTYAYLLGEFSDWRDANRFLTNILLQRYPDARVIRYKKGNRLVR